VADLCAKCHSRFDNYEVGVGHDMLARKIDHSEQMLACIIRTVLRRIEQGVLTVK
jgi:hypothetical protein